MEKTKSFLFEIIVGGILIFFFVVLIGSTLSEYNKNKEKAIEVYEENIEKVILKNKGRDIEDKFKLMYETIRTISLLPSVRKIEGLNRKNEEEDILKEGRFSQDAYTTVQQLYNNLASNVDISEIYCVIDGLDYEKKREVPFFMFDNLILGNDKENKKNDELPLDFPDELEDEEYSYYPKQIEKFKKTNPRFNYKNIGDIPSTFSTLMRTCDNSQYVSKSETSETEAYGITYSVPFYKTTGELNGIISVVFRKNILEAELIGDLFVNANKYDEIKAEKLGIKFSEEVSNIILYSEKYGVYIYDRRNSKIRDALKNTKKTEKVITLNLNTKGDAEWKISYYITESELQKSYINELETFKLKIELYLILFILCGAGIIFFSIRKRKNTNLIKQFSVQMNSMAEGDFTQSIDKRILNSSNEVKELAQGFEALSRNIKKILFEINSYSDTLASDTTELSETTENMKNNAEELAETSNTTAAAVEEMAGTVASISNNVNNLLKNAKDTSMFAEEGGKVVKTTIEEIRKIRDVVEVGVKEVNSLGNKANEIGEIIIVIHDIAAQTNLLALNAAIEAARAGEAGKGFEVVAEEVRKLAEKTSKSTKEIEKMIKEIQSSTGSVINMMQGAKREVDEGAKLADNTGDILERILYKIEELSDMTVQISTATTEQSKATRDIANQTENVNNRMDETKYAMEESAKALHEIAGIAEKLNEIVRGFKLDIRK